MPIDLLSLALSFIGFLYWPLLYISLSDKRITRKAGAFSALFAAALSLILFFIGYSYSQFYLPLMTIIAIAPVALLVSAQKTARSRRIKITILAAYFHVAWQMLPKIDIILIAADLAGIGIVIAAVRLSRYKIRIRKKPAAKQEITSISDLWK